MKSPHRSKHFSSPRENYRGVGVRGFLRIVGFGQLGNAWHIPNNTVPTNGANMRSPLSSIDPGGTVTIYNGNQFQGSGNPGNQSGGAVFYKAQAVTGSLPVRAARFFPQSVNDKYWAASFTAPPSDNGVIQYYLQINYTDHTTTYLYGTDSTSNATADSAFAAAHPFTFDLTPTLTVNGVNANYTTEHVYVDEIAGDTVPFQRRLQSERRQRRSDHGAGLHQLEPTRSGHPGLHRWEWPRDRRRNQPTKRRPRWD